MQFPKYVGSPWQQASLPPKITSVVSALTATSSRRRRVLFFAANILFLAVLWTLKDTERLPYQKPSKSRSYFHDKLIGNGTLGFEKIFTIGLNDRFDKRDAIELAADVSNLQLTWMDGVPGQLMNQKAMPPTFKLPGVPGGVIGCWRSHMNVIQHIVRNKISSALILEDDADWDLHIVTQMQQFASATKELLTRSPPQKKRTRATNSPYGEGWDMLWIGHCGGFHANILAMPHAIIKNDQTVPPSDSIEDMLFGVNPYVTWNRTGDDWHCAAHEGRDPPGKTCNSPRLAANERIVQERAKPVCTVAYAVSLSGARKMLARLGGLSLQDVVAPLDQGMGDICAGSTDLPGELTRCFTPSPPYIRGYKPRGPMSGDSDIRKTGTGMRDVGFSKGIMWSTRLNANAFVSGVDLEPESQYVWEGTKANQTLRYRKATEYRSYKPEVKVERWIWL